MESTTKRPGGEQPPSLDGVHKSAPSDASQHVSDLQADGNSCAEDVRKSRLSRNSFEHQALRNSLKVLARRELSAEQKVELIGKLIEEAREAEIQRLIKEKMAREGLS